MLYAMSHFLDENYKKQRHENLNKTYAIWADQL